MKSVVTSFVIATAMITVSVANAQVIFDVTNDADPISLYSNAMNGVPTFATGPPATLTRSDRALSHFVSGDDIQTLNGASLTATDEIRLTWVVDSITGFDGSMDVANMHNNAGVEFGVVSLDQFRGTDNLGTVSRFRGDSLNVVNANRIGHSFGSIFADPPNPANPAGQTENEETVEGGFGFEGLEDSFADGFTITQTITAAGVITQYSDIVVTDQAGMVQDGITTLTTILDPFNPDVIDSDADFVAFMNSAHFYAGASIADTAGGVLTFSLAQIEINPPSTGGDFVPPAMYQVFRGIELSGAITDFEASDDVRAQYNPGFTINTQEAPVWLIFDAVAPSATEFLVESQAGTPGLMYTFEAFDWAAAAFVEVAQQGESFGLDVVTSFPITSANIDLGGEVRSRVGWRRSGFTINFPWEVRVDQVGWN